MLIARQALEEAAVDNSLDEALFKEDLLNIARTTLSSKLLNVEKDHFAALGKHRMMMMMIVMVMMMMMMMIIHKVACVVKNNTKNLTMGS